MSGNYSWRGTCKPKEDCASQSRGSVPGRKSSSNLRWELSSSEDTALSCALFGVNLTIVIFVMLLTSHGAQTHRYSAACLVFV